MPPKVSVIIPAFNAVEYVRDAVQSVRDQTIEHDAVEILVVDDGSTDGTAEVLAELADEDPRLIVRSQENSGTPGGARNPALDRAAGEYVFFLDSDDKLAPDALRRMVATADAEGSDVVLGKLGSLDGRKVPVSMFHETVLDADVVENAVFNTLGPTKLIRRSLIEELGLRFADDQKVGEDQPFMAALYLEASKISILADMEYYLIRHRDDGENMTLSGTTSESQLWIAVRLAQAIVEHTEPGERRDALLQRPFGRSMRRALDGRWSTLDRAEQEHLAQLYLSELAPHYSDGVRERIRIDVRAALDLLSRGDLDGLQQFTEFLARKEPVRVQWRDGAFVRHLPEEISALVRPEDRVVPAPKMSPRLEDVRIDGRTVTIAAKVQIPDLDGSPDSLALRAKRRGEDEAQLLRTTSENLHPGMTSFTVTGEIDGLSRGLWDIHVLVRFGEREFPLRVGAERARVLAPEGVSNLGEDPLPQDRLIAYYTRGPGNLTIDSGGVLHRNLVIGRSVGLTLDENGRALLLVQLTSPPAKGDEFFAHLDAEHQRGARQLLPMQRLGERLVSLRLPADAGMVGATMTFDAVIGGVRQPLTATGTEFWPSRAAGFGFALTEDGGLRVTVPSESGRDRIPLPGLEVPVPSAGLRARVAPVVKGFPVLGPVLVRTVRAVRERRS